MASPSYCVMPRLLVAALVAPACTWISTSQARYGANLEELRRGTRMESTANADRSLGWLWSAPRSTTDARGLGQSITWAWDPELCDSLLPAFDGVRAFGIPIGLDCSMLKT